MRALKGVDIFHPLKTTSPGSWLSTWSPRPSPGATSSPPRAAAHWLYVLAKGRVELWAERDDGRTHITSIDAGGGSARCR